MFEKEADKYARGKGLEAARALSFRDGAIFGYNKAKEEQGDKIESSYREGVAFGKDKANEWHYPSKGELPNCTRQVLICYGMGERMKFVYWRADLGTFGSALPTEITAWRYIEPPKKEE